MPDFAKTCPVTQQPCVMRCFDARNLVCGRADCAELAANKVLEMSDEQIYAEHLARYGGNKVLAQKAIDMLRAKVEKTIGNTTKH